MAARAEPQRRNHAERLEALRGARRAAYLDRKARQVCIDCAAPLEEDDGLRCGFCDERDKAAKSERNTSPRGRVVRRRQQARYRRRQRARGLCLKCPAKATSGQLCARCRAVATKAQRDYRARKAAGITVLSTERRKRRTAAVARVAAARREVRAYRPLDELERDPRRRVLRALLRLDWPTASEIFDVLNVEDGCEATERSTYAQVLSRLARRGLIERRGPRGAYEHRLTAAGVAAARNEHT